MKLFLSISLIIACACAEEPNTPSNVSLIGSWRGPETTIFTLSNFRMELNEQDTGIVRGKWFAHSTGGGAGCPAATPCDGFGFIVGRTTVSGVEIELLGAGRFDGRLVDGNTLRGAFEVGGNFETMTFQRTSVTPSVTKVVR